MRWFRAVALLLVAIVGLGACGSESSPRAARPPTSTPTAVRIQELPARLDNGAQGLPQAFPPGHHAPTQACGDRLRATKQSLIVRRLPNGPRTSGGALAFTSGICVYLPPGYLKSGLRYPVIYLLHGGGGDAADAVTFGRIRELMDERIARDPKDAAIVVMPDGTIGRWYDSNDGTVQNERYIIDSVIPYVDQELRTIATREGRAIDGVSNGGHGAILLAAKHPDQFAAAGGMSSNLDALTLPGLGEPAGSYYRRNHPTDLVARLDRTPLILDVASRCTSTVPADLCPTQVVDQAFLPANRAFVAARRARSLPRRTLDYLETDAAHQWIWWNRALRDRHLPFLQSRLANPR